MRPPDSVETLTVRLLRQKYGKKHFEWWQSISTPVFATFLRLQFEIGANSKLTSRDWDRLNESHLG